MLLMVKFTGKLLNIYEEEIGLFLWSALAFFLIRSSDVLFNNFAETAFLKRYGVEYLPIVYMVNSISTFFTMGFLTGFMKKMPGSSLLAYMLLIFGSVVAGLRFLIPLGFDLLYPVLFVLKSQFEVLFALVFWNLANELFNTRQSKRIFPLITGGGVLGAILGSFGTPFLARAITLDNLLLVYLALEVLGAMTVKKLGKLYPTTLIDEKEAKKKGSRSSLIEEFRKVLPLIKESKLLKIMIMITLMPNIVIPIMNYQFNFAIDQAFATEGKMLEFFGYFRGVLNIVSLIILLFVGRIYKRLGLPVALMFHPFNYMVAFMAFLLRFDIFSAMYARISINVLRTTINNPARAVLMGLFPKHYRALIMPFLRGTVVRVGVLAGSGLIMVSEGLIHPRYLSVAGALFTGLWIVATIQLKKGYPRILSDLIAKDMIDLKSMEEKDAGKIFLDKNAQLVLIKDFLSASGDTSLWYAQLLKSLSVKNLDELILEALKNQDDKTRSMLIPLLSPDIGERAITVLSELVDPEKSDLTVSIINTINTFPSDICVKFNQKIYESIKSPDVKAYAVIGLFGQDPQKYGKVIDSWLGSEHITERKAGVIAAGGSGDKSYISRLKGLLTEERNVSILPFIFEGLRCLGAEDLNKLALMYFSHPKESVRSAALEVFEITDDETLRETIRLMGDSSEKINKLAKIKIETSSYYNPVVLIERLTAPQRSIREGIFYLFDSLDIKNLDIIKFTNSQIRDAYAYLVEKEALQKLTNGYKTELLIDHLDQERLLKIENLLRVLAVQDKSGTMRIVWRGIFSMDKNQRANSYEALDDLLDKSLSKIMMPLLELSSPSEAIAIGRKKFKLPDFDHDEAAIFRYFLSKEDWLTVVLALHMARGKNAVLADKGLIKELTESKNAHVRQIAQVLLNKQPINSVDKENNMDSGITISDKILHLKGVEIFKDLSVRELAAIASVTEEIVLPEKEIVIREGEYGETMYLIITGDVSVIKDLGGAHEIELDRIGPGDYFGEMALFEDVVRSASIRTERETRLLVLNKLEFKEIVREYPKISMNICRILSGRIRRLHKKILI
jgi:ATP/ADP translocase/HEAT repeat protein